MALLLRNWPLKLGALLLSVLLYAGLVYSGSFTEQEITGVPIRATNQPLNTYLLTGELGTVDVGYRASASAAGERHDLVVQRVGRSRGVRHDPGR